MENNRSGPVWGPGTLVAFEGPEAAARGAAAGSGLAKDETEVARGVEVEELGSGELSLAWAAPRRGMW